MSREICTYSPLKTRPVPNVAVMSPELLAVAFPGECHGLLRAANIVQNRFLRR